MFVVIITIKDHQVPSVRIRHERDDERSDIAMTVTFNSINADILTNPYNHNKNDNQKNNFYIFLHFLQTTMNTREIKEEARTSIDTLKE